MKILYNFIACILLFGIVTVRKYDTSKISYFKSTFNTNSINEENNKNFDKFLNVNVYLNIDEKNIEKSNFYLENYEIAEKIGIFDNFNNIYISAYSPIITISLNDYDKSIELLSSSPYVNKIHIVENFVNGLYNFEMNEYKELTSDALLKTTEFYSLTNESQNVKVAVLEFYNIQPNNYINCEVITLPENPVYDPTNDVHKLNVGATLYETCQDIILYDIASSFYNFNYITILDLLVSNDIHLATMSYGGDICQSYVEEEQIFDYYISTYDISIMKSASNFCDETYPGGANNIFSVGSMKSINEISFCEGSLTYNCPYNDKPNILTIGNSPLDKDVYATSYATPRFAGYVAQLFLTNSDMMNYPELVMSLFSTSANINRFVENGYNNFSNNGMENRCGAGSADLATALEIISNTYYGKGSIYSPREAYLVNRSIYLEKGKEITISLVTPKKNFMSRTDDKINMNTNIAIPSFAIKISKNNIKIDEIKSSSPVKILRYTATASETITLSIVYPGYQTYSNQADYAYSFIIR